MTGIIPDTTAPFNNYLTPNTVIFPCAHAAKALAPSNDSSNPAPIPRNLTDLEVRILIFYFKEWDLIGKASDRTLKELALIFKRDPSRVSDGFKYLTEAGFLKRERILGKGSGRRYNTWITPEGYSYLVNQTRSQTQSQIVYVPYIDLSKAKGLDLLNLEEQETCEQIIFDHNEDIDIKVDNALMHQKVPYGQRDQIKHELLTSRIGPVRIERVITRMIRASKKKPIDKAWAYIKRCIKNEQKELADLFCLLKPHNLPFHEYSCLT